MTYWDEDAQEWVSAPAGGVPPLPAVPPQPPVPDVPAQPPPGAPDGAAAPPPEPGVPGPAGPPPQPAPGAPHGDTAAPDGDTAPLQLPWQPPFELSYDTPYADPADPGRRPSGSGGRGAGVTAVLTALAVAVVGGAAVGGWLLLRDDGGDPKPDRAVAQDTGSSRRDTDEPTPTPTGTPSDTASASPTSSAAPTGYTVVQEEAYVLTVPEGWERRTEGVSVYFEEPRQDGAFVQVFEVTEPGITPYEAVRITEETKQGTDGYRLNDLTDDVQYAEYDYSYTDDDLNDRRVLLRDFYAQDGKIYALLVSAPGEEWPVQRQLVDEIAASFCSGPGCTAAAPSD